MPKRIKANYPSKVLSGAIVCLDAQLVEVETDIAPGLRCFDIVGLGDKAVQESRKRIGSAIKSAGYISPYSKPEKVLVNLAPADLKKEGSIYDLPIALGYLIASKQIQQPQEKILFIGELALNGSLRPVKGALSFSLLAKKSGIPTIVLPWQNAKEASLAKGIKVIGAKSVKEVADHIRGQAISPFVLEKDSEKNLEPEVRLDWIRGQNFAKRALQILAAGNHHLMMIGPPGTGKTLLAKSVCSILPRLSFEQSLEVTKIYSIAGLLPKEKTLVQSPPFRAPHHTSSEAALIGGGNPPQPGEITLSHHGIIFLDEFPEFHRDVLESLRQPLEQDRVTILRAKHRISFPAKFTMICAANPCPCGYYGHPEKRCACLTSQIQKYRRKLRGPLIDRIDIFIQVPQVKYEKLTEKRKTNETERIKTGVKKAREIQKKRFAKENFSLNSEIPFSKIEKYCSVPEQAQSILRKYVNENKLSARGYHRVLKIARTIADLEGSSQIKNKNVSEALMFRNRDRED